LDGLTNNAEKTLDTLTKYSEEDKKESRLTQDVKVIMTACANWADQLEQNQISPSLLNDIDEKSKKLETAIQNEVLALAIRVKQKQDVIIMLGKLSTKKPLEYFDDGKYYMRQEKWMDAKTNFTKYRTFVENGVKVTENKGADGGVRDPKEDTSLKYLEFIQDKINQGEGCPQSDDLIAVMSSFGTLGNNSYSAPWNEWQKKYGTK